MGIDKGILAALADHSQKVRGPHFIFSAESPLHLDKCDLRVNHDQVLNHLFNSGYDAHEIKSHYGKSSKSVIVYEVNPVQAEDLHKLVSRLGQGHSIYSDGTAAEMRFHHGAYAGRSHYGNEVSYSEEAPTDGFHTLPGGSLHFDHKFDYKSHHMAGQLDKWSKRGK